MTNELQVFENNQFGQMRTITENGNTLFCATDVARMLGYSNPHDAIARHCRGVVKREGVSTTTNQHGVSTQQTNQMSFIPEGDVYRLITHSKLPTAEKFESWVFDEVLPSIRKTGAYMTPETIEKVLMNPDTIISLATQLKELQTKVEQDKPKVQYFDTLVDRNLLTNFRDTAKELHVAPKAFINFLLEKGYIYRDNKSRLRPYQAHAEKGLFEVKEFASEFNNKAGIQTLITPKGRETFRLLVGNGLFG
ncbi:MAG: phage antirepressor KilAC domain-containing protein [Eubacteriales bacterium]|nr:phage antirepressor KilAC domain-containing protein [Eubacteriales bacterium]